MWLIMVGMSYWFIANEIEAGKVGALLVLTLIGWLLPAYRLYRWIGYDEEKRKKRMTSKRTAPTLAAKVHHAPDLIRGLTPQPNHEVPGQARDGFSRE